MKKSFYSIGSIIILLLAAFIFVLVPALANEGEINKLPDYGSYDGKPIRFVEGSDFYNEANRVIERFQSEQKIDFNSPYASTYYAFAFDQAFKNVVAKNALLSFTSSSGYKVSDVAVDREIRSLNEFKDSSGQFSKAAYIATSDETKIKIRNEISEQLSMIRSYEDIFGSSKKLGSTSIYGLKPSLAEINFITKMGEKQYAFKSVAFDMKNYPDSEKVAFGNAHKDLFVKYNLKVISCDTESKAKEVLKRINNSEITFEDAIKEYSTKHYGDDNGVLSASRRFQFDNAFVKSEDIEKVTSLAVDGVSPILETSSGFCIFKSFAEPTQPDMGDSVTVSEVYSYLLTREKSVIEDYYTAQAKDFAAKAASTDFNTAADSFNLTVADIAPSAMNYNEANLVGRSSIGANIDLQYAITNDSFFKTAFKLKKGEISSPVVLSSSNKVFVLKCTDIVTETVTTEDAKKVLMSEIANASADSINYSITTSSKIKDNSKAFLEVFNGKRG